MANTAISDLTALAEAPASGDFFVVVDVSDTTMAASGTDKRITASNLKSGLAASGANSDITSLGGLTTPLTVAQGGTGAATLTGILLGSGTSAITALSSSGTGNVARVSSPAFTTPSLGAATATSINGLTITTTTGTLTLANSSSIVTSGGNAITFTSTGTTGVTLPTSGTLTTLAGTESLSNKRITRRVVTVTQAATPTINTDNTDVAYITGLAQAITSFTTNLSGTPVNGDSLIISVTDNGTARALTFGTSFEASGNIALPTTTVISTRLDMGFLWNVATSKWRIVAVS